ncbi:ShlB/FhaC/HecB family hemolysin secretion/activation protein [Pedobacter nanyangensis]|uniref:ShlB/FhaC/HecB family hemolysin secretion/activation protein n=1 Tax=Pedobacter nanyangensis TaxID=1562389 RepID=UPI000DE3DB9F|nr:ShlB/FhaC/HecB family hemolysin secretion/activation protein [Pedobacter nanyangensis]
MRCFLVWLLVCFGLSSWAQNSYKLTVSLPDTAKYLTRKIAYQKEVPDSLLVYKEAEKVLSQLQFKGYLLAEITALGFKGKEASVVIGLNQPYKWVSLSAGNLSPAAKQAAGFRERNYENVIFNADRLNQLFEALLIYYENNGYPFASISLEEIVISDNAVSASIHAKPQQRIFFDTIEVVGSGQIAQKYIQSYLNIKAGAPYIEKTAKSIENRLRELPFLTVVKPTEIKFMGEKAKVSIYVNKKDANQFDGVIGLQQNGTTGKTQLVGNLRLHLQNAFKRGEQLNFNYQGLSQRSQLLDVKVVAPHVLNTDFGLSPSLYLYKQDSAFLNVDTKLGFNYLMKGNNTFQFFIENKSTRLSSVEAYKNATTLPPTLDANTIFYGLGLSLENLNYRYNPQKGYSLVLDVAVGSRKIKRNAAIPEHLYQNIQMNTTSYRWFSQINYYLPLAKQLVFALANQTGVISSKYLLENEVFRLGGQRSLRGFNELSVLATQYTYGNAELRYLLEQNSFLFAFYNQGYLKYKAAQQNYTDFPMGFGAGVNFETNLGILSISYALGKQRNNPLNLRNGKVHFGVTALF